MTVKNKNKKIAISDKLATDAAGFQSLTELNNSLKKRPAITKREKYYAVLGLLNHLKIEKRLWRIHDGSLVE